MNTMTDDTEAILRDVLDRWKSAVDAHEPQRVAANSPTTPSSRGCTRTGPEGRPSPPTTTHSPWG